jgi:hypothetical protein
MWFLLAEVAYGQTTTTTRTIYPANQTERTQQTEQRLAPNLVQIDSQHDVIDVNRRWQTTETRAQQIRTIGPGEVVTEELVQISLDGSGKLTPFERTVSLESTANDSKQVVTEIYSTYVPGVAIGPGSPLQLSQRIRVTSKPTPNGGSQTITETEARVPTVTTTEMQIVERRVETVREIAPGLFEIQRQTFALDNDGRLSLSVDEKRTTAQK